MNTTLKAILISLGSLFTALFLTFAIGMCTTGFRQMMFRVWNVVPEQQYTEKANSESSLKEELNRCSKEIVELSNERQNLLDKITSLDANNEEQAKQIAEYTNQVAELNAQIKTLNKKINNISTSMSNATIEYQGVMNGIHLPIFDTNGNFQYTTVYQVNGSESIYNGTDLANNINNNYKNIESNFNQALNSSYSHMLQVTQNDRYYVSIEGSSAIIDTNYTEYKFSSDSVLTVEVNFDGDSSDFDTILTDISSNKSYLMYVNYEWTLDDNGQISSSIVRFEIKQVQ